jgi:site-specific recombinase XerD
VTVDGALIEAFQTASSKHTLAALRSDWSAFDLWCRQHRRITLPATAQDVTDYLGARAGQGARPASLARYKASIARLHQLLGLVDLTLAPLVKLTLAAIRREKGVAQRQAAPLRFKGPVSDIERDPARGLNLRALLESCGADPLGLRDRALLSLAYDTGLRASELVAVTLEDIMPATDPDARLLTIARSKGDSEGEGATAFLSPRTVRAVEAWTAAAASPPGRYSAG